MAAVDPGKALSSSTTRSFVTALVVNGALLGVEVLAFFLLKQKLWRIYGPRTVLPPPHKRAAALPSGIAKWLPALIRYPAEDIIHKNGLDAYMFLRYIKLLIWIFLVFTLSTFVVIIPADAVGITSDKEGLERISWTNIIQPRDQSRFSAHIVVAYVLTFFVVWMIRREMAYFVNLRHQFLISPSHSRLAQARTVLITSVPDELANERDLRSFASFVPGGVDRVWLYRDTRSLNDVFERRQDTCLKLEAAGSSLLVQAVSAWRKKIKHHKKAINRKRKDEEGLTISNDLAIPPLTRAFLDELVPPAKRPHHRTGFLGMIGQKVDTIDWCTKEIAELNGILHKERENIVKGKFLGSAFIRCNLQMGAHVLAQCVSYHEPSTMYSKWMEAHPKDIVWHNLDDGALEVRGRYLTSWAATVGLIIAWAFPVGFIGTLSNLSGFCVKFHWLNWLCAAPKPVLGLIQGVLPPALLAALFSLLPFILRGLAWYECIPRYSLIAVSVYKRFYFFLLIHGFLIVTLSSGITRAIQNIIENPAKTVQELASQLPGASVFFLTYMVTQGLAGAGAALVQLAPLALHFLRKWFLGRTPRQAYGVTFLMPHADLSVIFPRLSLLATIGFAYSVLSPLINLLAFITYLTYYLAWKFLLSQVIDQPDELETGGLYFPMAINNLFVGLYIEQVSLACLFFLKASGSVAAAIAQAVLMLVLLCITALAQLLINHSFNPIIKYLPMSLATQQATRRYEKYKEKEGPSNSDTDDNDVDLFSRTTVRNVRKRTKKTTKQVKNDRDSVKVDSIRDSSSSCDLLEGLNSPQTSDDKIAEALGLTAGSELYPMKSLNSIASKASSMSKISLGPRKSSSKASKKKDKALGKKGKSLFFDRHPALSPATEALTDDSDDSEEDDAHAFDHPSIYVEQPWIWIPRDHLGLSGLLVKELQDAGVNASDLGAEMQVNGVVEVTRNPPDEEWTGGHDA
ncbi:hypothetical protein Agabi119p4_1788 [Agaricus bisporus var. burnettii]|uniref:DUF221-domain-containing protein n=1 Tax=Agaricus bisporus var. burnettii TaxID=192524 RepID=A0A8H7F802_AGABI|nr:hypothetical protein Agabi119p4_1788 [Agaricus bisporus var. burnettii]